jgi:membrane-associated phospholipid phosphatase
VTRPSDRLTAIFLAAVVAAALLGSPPSPLAALGLAALGAATGLLARAAPSGGPADVARDFFPVLVVLGAFLLLEPVITGVNPRRWDAVFAALDVRLLGPVVTAWRGAFGRPPAFTDAVYLAYVSYYALPVAVAAAARARGREPFERTVFAILLCFYGSFAGYFLFPTSGPRLPPEDEARLLGGGAIAGAVRAFLHVAEQTRLDAFPSGHTAIALVSAAAGSRVAPRLAPALFAWAGAIVFSTVYVHVHYAVDILAGVALAALTLAAAPSLARALRPRRARALPPA